MMKFTWGLFSSHSAKAKQVEIINPVNPDARKVKQDEIKQFREEARHYLDKHNALVDEFWRLNHLSTKTTDPVIREEIEESKRNVTQIMEEKQYEAKHLQAVESAKALEIELYGYSELSSESFYVL